VSSVATKHLKENEIQEDSKLINSIISNKDAGAKRTQKEASQHLKRLRTSNIIQEIHEKEDSDVIDWQQEDNEAKNINHSNHDDSEDRIEQQEKEVVFDYQKLESLKHLFTKLKLKTELEDIDKILMYYKEGGKLNEDLYNQNLALEKTVEEMAAEKEILDRDLRYLREKNNEFDQSKKDSVMEQYIVGLYDIGQFEQQARGVAASRAPLQQE
jgi:hypothetical protein